MTKSKFIVVEHNAKKARLHWDLRFIMPKSKNWMSFAIRKGVPLEPGKKVLAVRTHDHTEEEALFLGTIKQGYGAGHLKKWDDGQCIIHKFGTGHILIEFKGRKVKGIYHLISTGVIDKDFKRQTYMLFKGKLVNENFPDMSGSGGMGCRLPPADTSDTEERDEDNIIHPPLPWNKRNSPHKSWAKKVNELGMASRIPNRGEAEEVETTSREYKGKKLPWSKAKNEEV